MIETNAAQLEQWQQVGWLRPLDVSFANLLLEQESEPSPWLAMLAALASYQLGRGQVSLNLASLLQNPAFCLQFPRPRTAINTVVEPTSPEAVFANTSLHDVIAALQKSRGVSVVHDNSETDSTAPLVLQQERLYLRRYWRYQQGIKTRLQVLAKQREVNKPALQQVLKDLFGNSAGDDDKVNWQKLACANTLRSGFSVITGGPGTGKTYTVVRLLATLQQLSMAEGGSERILLAAPTGKAAARMTESVRSELKRLTISDAVKQSIDANAVTLHRLLGAKPGSRGFKHHADNPLLVDTLIIDEASMVDVEMMAFVVDALPSHARLILLGDKDQLASVEAGAVLGELCAGADTGGYNSNTVQWLEQVTGESIPAVYTDSAFELSAYTKSDPNPYLQHIVMLRESRRFDGQSGIGKLATEVNGMRTAWLQQWLQGNAPAADEPAELYRRIQYLSSTQPTDADFRSLVQNGLADFMARVAKRPADDSKASCDQWAEQVLDAFSQFQVLCAVRDGDWGTKALNELISHWATAASGSADSGSGNLDHWYLGRPVMITRNDYGLDLRNGDIGIMLLHTPTNTRRVAFLSNAAAANASKIRWVLPSRLTHVETVYAMTVHKSQGSEFRHTVLVLPEHDTPVLTKELLYTGITRAREQFTLVAPQSKVLLDAVQRQVERG